MTESACLREYFVAPCVHLVLIGLWDEVRHHSLLLVSTGYSFLYPVTFTYVFLVKDQVKLVCRPILHSANPVPRPS